MSELIERAKALRAKIHGVCLVPDCWGCEARRLLDEVIPILERAQVNEELLDGYRKRAEKWLDEPSTQAQQRTQTLAIMAAILLQPEFKAGWGSVFVVAERLLGELENR